MTVMLKGGYVYNKDGFSIADVLIENDVIKSISHENENIAADSVIDCTGKYVFPGLVDVHVHLREPGFSYKETIHTGTLAAAHGGYTEVFPMPNLNPPPDCPEALKIEQDIIKKDAVIKVSPFAAITIGQKGRGELCNHKLIKEECGVNIFSDDGKGVQPEELMEAAMESIHSIGGLISAHCEDESLLEGGYIHKGKYAAAHGHRGICSESEWGPIKRDIDLVRKTGCRYHVCHVSTKESAELIRQAKKEGLPVSGETGPHYLVFSDKDLKEDGKWKMNPPLRDESDKEALIEAIKDGTLECIATDHAPHSAEEKSRGLEKSAMGIVGLECAFPALYTHLVKKHIITLNKLIEIMSVNPRKLHGLPEALAIGGPADICVYDLDAEYILDPNTFLSKGRATPFEGQKLYGKNTLTICDGKIVWQEEK